MDVNVCTLGELGFEGCPAHKMAAAAACPTNAMQWLVRKSCVRLETWSSDASVKEARVSPISWVMCGGSMHLLHMTSASWSCESACVKASVLILEQRRMSDVGNKTRPNNSLIPERQWQLIPEPRFSLYSIHQRKWKRINIDR